MLYVTIKGFEEEGRHAVKASNFFEECFDEEAHDAYRNSEEGQARWDAACQNGDYAMCWLSGTIRDEFTSYKPSNNFDKTAINCCDSWTASEYALTIYQNGECLNRPVFRVKFDNAVLVGSDTELGEETEEYVYGILSLLDGIVVERVA